MKILFVDTSKAKRRGPIGWSIIRWATGSSIVHACVEIASVVYQTSETVFEEVTIEDRLSGTPCHMFECVGADDGAALRSARSLDGSFYDYPGAGYIGLMGITERIANLIFWPIKWVVSKMSGKPIEYHHIHFMGNPYQIDGMYFCTEAAYRIAKAAGVSLPDWWEGSNVAPVQFYEYCKENTEKFHYLGCYMDGARIDL